MAHPIKEYNKMEKILTICIPTYNRSKCIVEQLRRLSTLSGETKGQIEIFVSDNCSTDDTKEQVLKLKEDGIVDFVYNRNPKNLGMDGNFVTCFRYATTKYVWVLGDDDYIVTHNLEKLVAYLSDNKDRDYGLIHIRVQGAGKGDFQQYEDANKLLQDIGIWTTFISGNIVNTKFVAQTDFDKYMGTFFTLVPLYLKASLTSPDNMTVNIPIFALSTGKGVNGGYNFFQVFVANLLNIYHEFLGQGMTGETYESMRKCVLDYVTPSIHALLVKPNHSRMSAEKGWSICFKEFGTAKVLLKVAIYELNIVYHKFHK